jgi:hypothetical protein
MNSTEETNNLELDDDKGNEEWENLM